MNDRKVCGAERNRPFGYARALVLYASSRYRREPTSNPLEWPQEHESYLLKARDRESLRYFVLCGSIGCIFNDASPVRISQVGNRR